LAGKFFLAGKNDEGQDIFQRLSKNSHQMYSNIKITGAGCVSCKKGKLSLMWQRKKNEGEFKTLLKTFLIHTRVKQFFERKDKTYVFSGENH
jgi:hypothetical protein